MTHDEAEAETIQEEIRRAERRLARCGDEYLAKVTRAEIQYKTNQLKALRAREA